MTGKERRFVDEYLIDLNACAAALRAGYAHSTARNASAWIDEKHPEKPKVREAVERRMAERSRRTGINAERVLLELARIGFANMADVVDTQTGEIRRDARIEDTAAITSTKCRRGEDSAEWEVRLTDKVRALELIGKHLGMWQENVYIAGAVPVIVDDMPEEAPEKPPIGYE